MEATERREPCRFEKTLRVQADSHFAREKWPAPRLGRYCPARSDPSRALSYLCLPHTCPAPVAARLGLPVLPVALERGCLAPPSRLLSSLHAKTQVLYCTGEPRQTLRCECHARCKKPASRRFRRATTESPDPPDPRYAPKSVAGILRASARRFRVSLLFTLHIAHSDAAPCWDFEAAPPLLGHWAAGAHCVGYLGPHPGVGGGGGM